MASHGSHHHRFELTGGDLCLDLANTVDNRPTLHTELLPDYLALLEWVEQAGVVSPEDSRKLQSFARKHPHKVEAVLARAKRLREAIFRVFSALANHQEIPPHALGELNAVVTGILAKSRIAVAEPGFTWAPANVRNPLESILWRVSRSTVDLLLSDEVRALRECAAPNCSWLFLDRSKNGSRRWCDMKTCGNRDKVRRFRLQKDAPSRRKHGD